MSNIKITDVQPAKIVDELFTELTDEQLSQISGGGVFIQTKDGTVITYGGGTATYSGKNGEKAYYGPYGAFYSEG